MLLSIPAKRRLFLSAPIRTKTLSERMRSWRQVAALSSPAVMAAVFFTKDSVGWSVQFLGDYIAAVIPACLIYLGALMAFSASPVIVGSVWGVPLRAAPRDTARHARCTSFAAAFMGVVI